MAIEIPPESDGIVAILGNVQVQRVFGIIREYDIVLSDTGMLFFLTRGAIDLGIRQGLSGGVVAGVGAGLPGGSGAFLAGLFGPTLKEFFESRKYSMQNKYQNLTEMLTKNEYNFFIRYSSIHKVSIKKKWNGLGGMRILSSKGKIDCEFALENLDGIKERLALIMGDKVGEDLPLGI